MIISSFSTTIYGSYSYSFSKLTISISFVSFSSSLHSLKSLEGNNELKPLVRQYWSRLYSKADYSFHSLESRWMRFYQMKLKNSHFSGFIGYCPGSNPLF